MQMRSTGREICSPTALPNGSPIAPRFLGLRKPPREAVGVSRNILCVIALGAVLMVRTAPVALLWLGLVAVADGAPQAHFRRRRALLD